MLLPFEGDRTKELPKGEDICLLGELAGLFRTGEGDAWLLREEKDADASR